MPQGERSSQLTCKNWFFFFNTDLHMNVQPEWECVRMSVHEKIEAVDFVWARAPVHTTLQVRPCYITHIWAIAVMENNLSAPIYSTDGLRLQRSHLPVAVRVTEGVVLNLDAPYHRGTTGINHTSVMPRERKVEASKAVQVFSMLSLVVTDWKNNITLYRYYERLQEK